MFSSGRALAVLVSMAFALLVTAASGQSMHGVVIVAKAASGTVDTIDGQSPEP